MNTNTGVKDAVEGVSQSTEAGYDKIKSFNIDDRAKEHSHVKVNGYMALVDSFKNEDPEGTEECYNSSMSVNAIVSNGVSCDSKKQEICNGENEGCAEHLDKMPSSKLSISTKQASNELIKGLSNLAINGVGYLQESPSVANHQNTAIRAEDSTGDLASQPTTFPVTQSDSSRSLSRQEGSYVSKKSNNYAKNEASVNSISNCIQTKCVVDGNDAKSVMCCDSYNHFCLKSHMANEFIESSGHTQISHKEKGDKNVTPSGKSDNALAKVAKENLESGKELSKNESHEAESNDVHKEGHDNSFHISKNIEMADISQSDVTYIMYESELNMPDIIRLIQKDLSEPYSIYTYRYFIHNWPHLCFMAKVGNECVGAIVCKLDYHKKVVKRGYIAMLAVDSKYRKLKIGSTLVRKAIETMIDEEADEVVLETEITNQPALRLYENLGFVRDKRLFRYYLNGVDALRLKLWLR